MPDEQLVKQKRSSLEKALDTPGAISQETAKRIVENPDLEKSLDRPVAEKFRQRANGESTTQSGSSPSSQSAATNQPSTPQQSSGPTGGSTGNSSTSNNPQSQTESPTFSGPKATPAPTLKNSRPRDWSGYDSTSSSNQSQPPATPQAKPVAVPQASAAQPQPTQQSQTQTESPIIKGPASTSSSPTPPVDPNNWSRIPRNRGFSSPPSNSTPGDTTK